MDCLPPTNLLNHNMLNGIMVHTRIDCPKDMVYFINEDTFMDDFKLSK